MLPAVEDIHVVCCLFICLFVRIYLFILASLEWVWVVLCVMFFFLLCLSSCLMLDNEFWSLHYTGNWWWHFLQWLNQTSLSAFPLSYDIVRLTVIAWHLVRSVRDVACFSGDLFISSWPFLPNLRIWRTRLLSFYITVLGLIVPFFFFFIPIFFFLSIPFLSFFSLFI